MAPLHFRLPIETGTPLARETAAWVIPVSAVPRAHLDPGMQTWREAMGRWCDFGGPRWALALAVVALLAMGAPLSVSGNDVAATTAITEYFSKARIEASGKYLNITLPGPTLEPTHDLRMQCKGLRTLYAKLRAARNSDGPTLRVAVQGWTVAVIWGGSGKGPTKAGEKAAIQLPEGLGRGPVILVLLGGDGGPGVPGSGHGGPGGSAIGKVVFPGQIVLAAGGDGGSTAVAKGQGALAGPATATATATNSGAFACGGSGGSSGPQPTAGEAALDGAEGAEATANAEGNGFAKAAGGLGGKGGMGSPSQAFPAGVGTGQGGTGGKGGGATATMNGALAPALAHAHGGDGGDGGQGGSGGTTLPGGKGGTGGEGGATTVKNPRGAALYERGAGGLPGLPGPGNPPGTLGTAGKPGAVTRNDEIVKLPPKKK